MILEIVLLMSIVGGKRHKTKFGRIRPKRYGEEYAPEGEVVYGSWARSECFKVEKGLLTFGYVKFLFKNILVS